MSGFFVMRGLSLFGVALLALGHDADAASAGSERREAPSVYDDTYTGPPVIRRIPGVRILFGDSALEDDEFDDGQTKKKKKKKQLDESYYEPAPAAPAKPKVVKPPATSAAKPPANPALPQKAAASPAKPLPEGPLSCEKATSVVSGYGFSSVEASTCSGKLYAFNAKRGGNSFAIKLDPASGELTEVKKLP